MSKQNALQRIESHEKLCRIMQKQTHQKINNIESEIKDIKKHKFDQIWGFLKVAYW